MYNAIKGQIVVCRHLSIKIKSHYISFESLHKTWNIPNS